MVSERGKEATITFLSAGDFIGEESIAGAVGFRLATTTAVTACTALKIERAEMIRVMHQEHAFSDLFVKFLLARSKRTQADLIDQLFNSSEKRLARILLLMAEFGKPGEPETPIPEITQETLVDVIGRNPSNLLEMVRVMAQTDCSCVRHPSTPAPIWIPKNGHDPFGEEYVMVTCPECGGRSRRCSARLAVLSAKQIASITSVLFTTQSCS